MKLFRNISVKIKSYVGKVRYGKVRERNEKRKKRVRGGKVGRWKRIVICNKVQ